MPIRTGHAWVVSKTCDGGSSPAYWAGSSWVAACSSSSSWRTSCGERASPSPTARPQLRQRLEAQLHRAASSTPTTTTTTKPRRSASTTTTTGSGDQPTVGPTIAAPNDGDPVGLLTIAKIGLNKVIVQGTSDERPAPGTGALPRHAAARRAGQRRDRRAPHHLRRPVLRPRQAGAGRPHRDHDRPGHVHLHVTDHLIVSPATRRWSTTPPRPS